MLLTGNGRLITRSGTDPYLENGAVVLDGDTVKETGTLEAMRAKYPHAGSVDARGGGIVRANGDRLRLVEASASMELQDVDIKPDGSSGDR